MPTNQTPSTVSRALHHRILLFGLWPASLVSLIMPLQWLQQGGSVLLLALSVILLFRARIDTKIITLLITAFSGLLIVSGAPLFAIVAGLERGLLFAALLPTLALIRATANRVRAIQLSQQRIQALESRSATLGILLGAQAFGAILNAGAFALTAALTARDAGEPERRRDALCALRGMNVAVQWSPFFVGFAVASAYFPDVRLWQIMPIGLALTVIALALIIVMFHRPLGSLAIGQALFCLRPLLLPLGVAATVVIAASGLAGVPTMTAILLFMPLLCVTYLVFQPGSLRAALRGADASIARLGDDLLIIVAAMVLGSVAGSAPIINAWLAPIFATSMSSFALLASIIGSMTIAGVLGLHPMISGTVLIVSLRAIELPISDTLIMEAFLVGWAMGTMNSLTSLSIVTVANLYDVRPIRLVVSPNLLFIGLYGLLAAALLSLISG